MDAPKIPIRRHVFFLVTASILTFHFLCTLLFLTPVNVTKLWFSKVISAYMQPFFQQNWNLFAPMPTNPSTVMLIGCRVKGDDGETEDSRWINITAPYREARMKFRFSSAERMDRLQGNAFYMLYAAARDEEVVVKHLPKESELRQNLEAFKSHTHDLGEQLIQRIASAHCDHYFERGKTVAVRSKIAVIHPPVFSKRFTPDEELPTKFLTFDWKPYQEVAEF